MSSPHKAAPAGAPDSCPVLIISTPKAGHINQCIAFCETADWPWVDIHRVPKTATLPLGLHNFISARKRAALAGRIARAMRGASHLRVVASGASAEHVVRELRKRWKGELFAVYVGAPRQQVFDAAIASRHEIDGTVVEATALARHTVWIDGVLVRRAAEQAPASATHLTALIGGVNRTYLLPAAEIAAQLNGMMSQLAITPAAVSIVHSRRTPEGLTQALREAFPGALHVAATDRTGFEQAMRRASHIAVTPDSITMVCEACATAKPVGVFALDSHNDDSSAARFIGTFRNAHHISWGRLPAADESLAPWDTGAAVEGVTADYKRWRGKPGA